MRMLFDAKPGSNCRTVKLVNILQEPSPQLKVLTRSRWRCTLCLSPGATACLQASVTSVGMPLRAMKPLIVCHDR